MIYGISISWFVVLICIHFSNGVSLNRFAREIKNNTECEELDKPDWEIDRLGNVTIDLWPWNCLQSHFTDHSLDTLISQSSLYEAVSKGYIGFVQYHMGKNIMPFGKIQQAYILSLTARSGHLNILKYFVEEKAFPVDANDSTLLLSAAFGGNVDLIRYLIDEKNVTKTGISPEGVTALHTAVLGGKLEAVRFFVETLNYRVNIKNSNGETPAHAASTISLLILRYLIEEKNADPNTTDDFRNTLLHSAAYYGQFEVVKYLVERKRFDIECEDNFGMTALHKAIRSGQLNVVKYLALERKANLNGKDSFSMNVLHQTVIGRNLDIMKFLVDDMNMLHLVEEMNFFNRTVAMEAAKYGTLSILRYLVDEKRVNTSDVDEAGCNMLHIAAREGELLVVKYLVEEKGFNVAAENSRGRTAYDITRQHEVDNSLLEYLEKKMNEQNHL